jgi:hypothetical protein
VQTGCRRFIGKEDAMKYTGPAKPIPTHIELISDKAERVIFLLLAIFLVVFLYLE